MSEERVGQQRRVGHRAGEDPDGVEARALGQDPGARDRAEARLEADDAAEGGRADHRAGGLGADGERHLAGCDGGRGTGRGAARGVGGVDRVSRRCRLHGGELGRRRLAEDQRARRLQPGDDEGVLPRHAPGVDGRAVLGRDPRGVDDVLDPDRHPVQRPDRTPGPPVRVERPGLGTDELRLEPRPGPELGLGRLDAGDRRLGEVGRRHRAGGKTVAQADRAEIERRLGRAGAPSHRGHRAASRRSAGTRRRAPWRG